MLSSLRVLFLLLITINLFANFGDRFTVQKIKVDRGINNYVDYFLLNKSKQKIDYLRYKAKLSLLGTRNDILNDFTILNARNSSLVDMVSIDANNSAEISPREIEILRTIDIIILQEDSITASYDCGDLANHVENRNLTNIDPAFTEAECAEVNVKFENFYETGVFSIKDLNGTLLNQYRSRVRLDNMCEYDDIVHKKIAASKRNEYDLVGKLQFLNNNFLELYSSDISSLTNNNHDFSTKSHLVGHIRNRANLINDLNNTIDISQTIINLNAYLFTPYTCGEHIGVSDEQNITQNIQNLLTAKQTELAQLNITISSLSTQHSTLLANEPPDLPFPPYNIQHDDWELQVDTVFADLTDAQQTQTDLQNEILVLQGYITNPGTIPDDGRFDTYMLEVVGSRIAENIIYQTITKINTLSRYINRYLLEYGFDVGAGNPLPRRIDLINISNFWGADEIHGGWWPQQFNGSTDIQFTINTNDGFIRFSNIFDGGFISSISEFETSVRQMFYNSTVKRNDVAIDITGGAFDMIVPLDFRTLAFVEKINEISDLNATVVGDINATVTPNPIPCGVGQNDQQTAFSPNGDGGFTLFYCDSINWETQNVVVSSETEIQNDTIYRQNNVGFSIFSQQGYGGEKVYRDLGPGNAQKGLIVNGIYRRIF
jgi:hypothetical protein